ncbi:aromatic ring-hydroxylating oxygenase subunit alpha [Streptomyces sp. Wh19]|uniref:aromatic ring-hydroxylating oxygenase subunit alpha n=1 Tax=Streptomyces sp. Wh19 TaxID=3076629 RepID=UPI002958C896|nr:aromatic ring-hydroxylating dioxygenase subunit alpha [Streptomyces sp. Wh19]MDV9194452.1 aromatic ring-hydroxylating dioxygenase subunit alpha [Streptomyces sp. Wh19]
MTVAHDRWQATGVPFTFISSAGGLSMVLQWPGAAYRSSEVFDTEQERIFRSTWLCVSRSARLPGPGSFLNIEIAGENILLVRNREGEVRALLNLCRHRGSLMCTETEGNFGRSIRCPYHSWTYSLDGQLLSAPYIAELSPEAREDRDLYTASATEWLGYIWVNLDPHAEPLASQMAPLLEARFDGEDVLAKYDTASLDVAHTVVYDVAANWKLIFENFCECYHCPTMHPELCAAVPQFRTGYGTVSGPARQGAELAADFSGFSLTGAATADPLPGLDAADERMFYGVLLWPSVSLNFTPDHVLCMRVEPLAADRTRVVAEWLFHPDAMAQPGFDPADAVKLFDVTNRQDFEVIELVQRGTRSRRFEQVYSPHEHLIGQFHEWVDDAMAATAGPTEV